MARYRWLLLAGLGLFSQTSSSQPNGDTNASWPIVISPLVDHSAAVPAGNSIRIAVSYPASELNNKSVYATMSLGIAGLLDLSYRRDGVVGSPAGILPPTSEVGIRLQVVPQRGPYPAVSAYLNTMTEIQSDLLGEYSLKDNLPGIYNAGLSSISYDTKSMVTGFAFSSVLGGLVSVDAAVGVRQTWWHQQWSKYHITVPYPTTSDGWTFPLSEHSTLSIDWSAGIVCQPLDQLSFLVEVHALPYMDIDPATLVIDAREGYAGIVGIRYSLPVALNVDLYDRWFSESGERTGVHQVRLGLSTGLGF